MKRALKKILYLLLISSTVFLFYGKANANLLPVTGMMESTVWAGAQPVNPFQSIFLNDQLETNDSRESRAFNEFIDAVVDGRPDVIRGLYVDEHVALQVTQQPAGQAGFVSSVDHVVTEFAMPKKYGVLGFLAHNYLAGRFFYEIDIDDVVQVIFGDGQIQKYKVVDIQKYRALQPNSPHSEFLDLSTSQKLTATELFKKVYTGEHHITLQTCIQEGDLDTWGRMFIIAEPLA